MRPLVLIALVGCDPAPEPLPTEVAVAQADERVEGAASDTGVEPTPPLYQLLYDVPVAEPADSSARKVRMLAWLRHMQLSPPQLDMLDELRVAAEERRARMQEAEAERAARSSAELELIYDEIWAAMAAGEPADSPGMSELAGQLSEARGEGDSELVRLRMEAIRTVLEAERPLLSSLTPTQEALLADSLFVLRHRLDPVGNPGDFRELVGTTYEPGQYAVLTRGTSEVATGSLDIGALWSDSPGLEGRGLHSARREVLLYLVLMEPGLGEAIAAARGLPRGE